MDFFERAHISKTHDNKNKKGDETMKKQLKLMLRGYKTSDTELIKRADNATVDLDDSTSVSGFSDLNLTVSSVEENSVVGAQDVEIQSDNQMFSSDISGSSSQNDSHDSNKFTKDDNVIKVSSITDESINLTNPSKSTNFSASISDEVESTSSILEGTANEFDMFSSAGSLSGSTQSEFDPDGQLALQILENIKSKDSTKNKKRNNSAEILPARGSKRSRNVITRERQEDKESMSSFVAIKKLPRQQTCPSPPFVSITATDVEPVRFDDVLGDYRHSTVKILPSVNINTVAVNNDIFSEECVSANVTTEEESAIIHKEELCLGQNVNNVNISMESQSDIVGHASLDQTNAILDESDSGELNNFSMYNINDSCVFVMKHPSELYFHGQLRIQRLAGQVEVGGYSLKDDEIAIITPSYSYAQCLKTIEGKTNNKTLSSKLKTIGLSQDEVKEIFKNLDKYDVVLLLKAYNNPVMEFVNSNFPTQNLFKCGTKEKTLEEASNCLGCSLYSRRPAKCFQENPAWRSILDIKPKLPFKGLVCGGKGSGKSTFVRYYVNRLLQNSPVLVIELDPGQSEFTVAGHVSATVVDSPIFGPSFTHLRTPKRALNIGIISVMDNIIRYVNAIKDIIEFSKTNYPHLPWVINTMGMTNGLGLQLMILVILLSEPNFILQYDSKNAKKRFESYLTVRNVMSLYRRYRNSKYFWRVNCPDLDYMHVSAPDAESITPSRSLIARDERYLNFLAYFGKLANCINPKGWLLEIPPYEVDLKHVYLAVNIPLKDCVTKVINGKVVGLCQHSSSRQCKDRVFTLSQHPLLCLGIGLVRGIDWEKQVLYVITPLHISKLHSVHTILYADWVPDLKGQEAHLSEGTVVPYRMAAQQEQMELMVAPKRRFNPLQLLKMTRNIVNN